MTAWRRKPGTHEPGPTAFQIVASSLRLPQSGHPLWEPVAGPASVFVHGVASSLASGGLNDPVLATDEANAVPISIDRRYGAFRGVTAGADQHYRMSPDASARGLADDDLHTTVLRLTHPRSGWH
jgi:hypothetical protein